MYLCVPENRLSHGSFLIYMVIQQMKMRLHIGDVLLIISLLQTVVQHPHRSLCQHLVEGGN